MVATGSDTRMYNPRSESNLGYTKDEDENPYGIGDPETMEQYKDKKQAEKDSETFTEDLPHLQLSVPEPEPEMPPMMPEEEEPVMDDDNENAVGAEISQMTGMPDTGNLSIGNAIGTMPQPGGTLMTGEPMEDAWSSLMKAKYLDENLSNVLYGQEDPVAEPVAEEPPHPASIEGDAETRAMRNELDRLRQEHVTLALNPQLAFSRGIQPHVQQDKIRELERELVDRNRQGMTVWYDGENNHIVGPFPTSAPIPKGRRTTLGDWFDSVSPQELNEEARANTPDLVRWGEPMDDAWSSLMKARLDKVKGAKDKTWKQPLYETQPGGAEIKTANPRRAKRQSRYVQPSKKRGLELNPWSVHRTHLGISTKQPLKLFPQQYGHQMATQARRKLMGNIPQAPAAPGFGPQTSYNPRSPKVAASQGLSIKEPREPTMRGASFAKSDELNLVKKDLEEVRKKMDYMHFAQIRRLLRRLKDATERQERRLKAAESSGKGNNREAGHREAMDSTTRPEGGTEDLENDPKNWGAPSTIFAARGSGRVG